MSKGLFEMMRMHEIQTTNFLPNKKEIQFSAKKFITETLEAGEIDKYELIAQAKRMQEALDVITTELIKVLPQEKFESFGLKGIFRNGGDTVNFKDCEIWSDISRKLKEREELLKTALKVVNEIYDEVGVLIPKVSTNPRKSTLSISF